MVNKLAIGIGAAVLVFVILFCVVPFKQVSYEATEQYQAPETVYVSEPYTTYSPATGQPEVTLYQDVPKQTYVWKERPVTLYKKVSMLEYLVAY
jgi:hypothetical protein